MQVRRDLAKKSRPGASETRGRTVQSMIGALADPGGGLARSWKLCSPVQNIRAPARAATRFRHTVRC
jgi:hypothetical protein